jgi:diguanylate cyclase (GGDEF)-like protein
MNELVEFLKTVHIFSQLSDLERDAVSAFLENRQIAAEGYVCRQGDKGAEIFIIKSGSVSTFITTSSEGEREICSFGPGRFFGEMAIIDGLPRSASCKAREDTELLVMDGIDFFRLVWEFPMIGVKMLSAMSGVMVGWLSDTGRFLGDMVRWGERARKRAITDELSGLFNRRFLEECLQQRFARGSALSRRCSLLMLDLDRFRDINAEFGNEAGDAAISTVGTAIDRLSREGDIAARLSGDEFAVFLPNTSRDDAKILAESMRAEVETLYLEFRKGPRLPPERVTLTASFGVASSPEEADSPEELLSLADKALYRAKESGRNRVSSS